MKLFLTILCFALTAEAEAATKARLVADCSPARIYPGQNTVCQFILYANSPVLEVEVAKFPEFRGYWTENLSLRQGPINLLPTFGQRYLFKAPVGSYSLTPMVSRKTHTIEPMKTLVKDLGESQGEFYFSEPASLTITPLPPVPQKYLDVPFLGLVGYFQFIPEVRHITFQKDEPVTLRYLMLTEGNVLDALAPALPFPKYVEVLSKRSLLEGALPGDRKIFEYSLAIHEETGFALSPDPLLTFDPAAKRYRTVTIPPVTFQFRPKPMLEKNVGVGMILENINRKEPKPYIVISETRGFLWAHGFLFALFLTLSLWHATVLVRERRETSKKFLLRLKYEIALEASRNGRTEDFMRLGEAIAVEWLKDQAPLSRETSRSRTLAVAKRKIPDETSQSLAALFRAHDMLLYSPEKTLPVAIEEIQHTLSRLIAA